MFFISDVTQPHTFFGVFPYLKTSESVRIRNVEFHSSNADRSYLSVENQQHLDRILAMYYVQDNYRLPTPVTYASQTVTRFQDIQDFIRSLGQVRELLGYEYSRPQPPTWEPFLSSEHADLFVFHPEMVSELTLNVTEASRIPSGQPSRVGAEVEGYACSVNLQPSFPVAEGSRLYPQIRRLVLNFSQDVHWDLQRRLQRESRWAFRGLVGCDIKALDVERRAFTALRWYNRSATQSISDEEALVCLAIALETALGLPSGEGVTKRFKEAVLTLLGRIPRLEEWIDQFYEARSAVVHEGQSGKIHFYPAEAKRRGVGSGGQRPISEAYHPLIVYARLVFDLCLNTLLYGAQMTSGTKLVSLLVPNQERLEEMCRQLSEHSQPPRQRLLTVLGNLSDIQLCAAWPEDRVKPESVQATVKLLLQTILQDGKLADQAGLAAVQRFLQSNAQTPASDRALHSDLEVIVDALKPQQFPRDRANADLLEGIDTFLSYAINNLRLAYLRTSLGG